MPTSPGAQRPRFRERQVVRAADLEGEQSYLIAARRRHNIGQHGWGIVHGLEIVNTLEGEILVQPGIAVDGYGRELIVTAPVKIPSNAFTELGDQALDVAEREKQALDVWLLYELEEANVPQRGSYSCGPGRNSRSRQQARVMLTAAPHNDQRLPTEVPRDPMEVPSDDVPFLPHRTPPDDPASEWPVYLGTIKKISPSFNPKSPRPYAGLTGEIVTAPSGRARMQVGAELQGDTRRFAVNTPDSSGKLSERFAIDRDGNTLIRNSTTVTNTADKNAATRVRMRTGEKGMLNQRSLPATPAVAAPWQIYRTSIKEAKRTIQQQRVEIGHPGDKGDPKLFQLAVGTRVGTTFLPCFTLSADCTLTIEGNLKVKQLVEGPIKPDASDPRFTALVAGQWLEGTKVGVKTATTGSIQGTLRDKNNVVIPGGDVELNNLDTAFNRHVTPDIKSRFVAPDIPVGRYDITGRGTGFLPTTIQRTVAASETISVPIALDKIPPTPTQGGIRGTVSDAQGGTKPGINVVIADVNTNQIRTVTTNIDGEFNVPNLPPGNYSIRADSVGSPVETRTLAAGQTLTVDITIPTAVNPL